MRGDTEHNRNQSKIMNLPVFPEIRNLFDEHAGEILSKRMTYIDFYRKMVLPILPENSGLKYNNFHAWARKHLRERKLVSNHRSLMDREQEKLVRQIEIRQDVTKLMQDFLRGLHMLADDPMALSKAGIKPDQIYKIIREEEDRQKTLQLRERAENRADAAFAFLVSVTRANQLTDEDIEFLEETTKAELIQLKQKDGIYELPSPTEFLNVEAPAETSAAVAS